MLVRGCSLMRADGAMTVYLQPMVTILTSRSAEIHRNWWKVFRSSEGASPSISQFLSIPIHVNDLLPRKYLQESLSALTSCRVATPMS